MGYYNKVEICGVNTSKLKTLTTEEKTELLERSSKGDKAARELLIDGNLRLVLSIVQRFSSRGENMDDLFQVGCIGLIKAIDSFNIENGARFATYAARCIENEILMYFRSQKKNAHDVLISDPIDTDKEGNTLTLIDVIADDTDITDDIDLKLRLEKLKGVIARCLDNREKLILTMRYGLGGTKEYTQREIAAKLKISRSYVSRIEKSALIKLKCGFDK